MKNFYTDHESGYIKNYQAKGYRTCYFFDGHHLIDTLSKKKYTPNDICIVAENRFEGISDPSDISILYALKTVDGFKGTLLVGFGPSADLELSEFFKEIPMDQFMRNTGVK
tara:strand:+ start:117368 stop:117700 length:333 start_codon:yes stop_codon:yes gene_type:complete